MGRGSKALAGFPGEHAFEGTVFMQQVRPDRIDYAAVESECGPLPADAGVSEQAERFRFAQAAKLIRQYGPKARQSSDNTEA